MFGRKKKEKEEVASAPEQAETTETKEEKETAAVQTPGEFDRSNGPWDIDEIDVDENYIDFGSMRIRMIDGLNMRLDVEQKSQQMVAVTLTKGNNSLQVQAFAAPKSTGIWDDIRAEIADSVRKQGGTVEIRDAGLGREMISKLPAKTKDGRKGFRVARFVGVDGPRWFLRGVYSGDAALRPADAAEMEEIFRSIVVVRGEDPRPPRDLLPMTVPASIREAQEANKQAEEKKTLDMPERGPEIAEVR